MANAKQVLDVQVSKGITTAQSNEHQRNRSEKAEKYAMKKGNYDPTRKQLNFEIAPGGKIRPIDTSRSIPERMADILNRRGIKDPNEGLAEPKYRTVVNIIFGGSRERMHELAFGTQQVDLEEGADNSRIKRKGDIERWAKDVYSFVSGRYGEQNIAAFIVHLDELNPHVHCTLLPIKDGKFAYKEIFAGKDKFEYSERMKQLHTDFFAEVNTKWGMSKGRSIAETGWKRAIDATPYIRRNEWLTDYANFLLEENRRDKGHLDQDRRTLAELKKILEIEGLLDTYSHLFGDEDAASGRQYPVNNYSGLNSLRARLKNRRWDGKSLLEGQDSGGDTRADTLSNTWNNAHDLGKAGDTGTNLPDTAFSGYNALVQPGSECAGSPVYFFFRLNTDQLTDASQKLNLDELARVAKKYGLFVKVTGAANSTTGTPAINDSLSTSRAEFIAAELERRGIPAGMIIKAGRGGITDYLPTEANRHTRVELFFSKATKTAE